LKQRERILDPGAVPGASTKTLLDKSFFMGAN